LRHSLLRGGIIYPIVRALSRTFYGTSPAPIYFNAGYMDQKTWWKLGLIISFVNIAIWMGVGFPWWKILGLW
jgi:DASS family divalent anion:Na+ symporter